MSRTKRKQSLADKYPPSRPCGCEVCLRYCIRPGWWTVREAVNAFDAGYGKRMMLELAPDRSFGVLSPAFKGNEGTYALNLYTDRGCSFLNDNRCELHSTGFQPLECRFCHHDRPGLGPVCHADIEQDWTTPAGRDLVIKWCKFTSVWASLRMYGLEKLMRAR